MKHDIQHKLQKDFGSDFYTVLERINEWDAEVKSLLEDRVLRSVIYLADGDLKRFELYKEIARRDVRDVFWQAEYDEPEGRRKRDFSKVFEQSDL